MFAAALFRGRKSRVTLLCANCRKES